MFEINQVFSAQTPIGKLDGVVRVLDTVGFEAVMLINIDLERKCFPFKIEYEDWVDHINSGRLVQVTDPFEWLTSIPPSLPRGAKKRLHLVTSATEGLSATPDFFWTKKKFNKEISKISSDLKLHKKTVKGWICEWLQAGRNPVVVVRKFLERKSDLAPKKQPTGAKRGAKPFDTTLNSGVASHEVEHQITRAYYSYVGTGEMSLRDAYHEMLLTQYKLPPEALSDVSSGLFVDPAIAKKYRTPSLRQFTYRCRVLRDASKCQEVETPRGSRGKSTDNVPGPGFYEIDATHFQIQLISRLTRNKLVGRPTVYLIVDTYDGMVTGYAVSLENPSWAVAALALYNCFCDKSQVFERLGLPYSSQDWPCHHLPNLLRADRAELVSNMGHRFATSGIRVEITPSMTPIAKGTVEGKNAEIKNNKTGRFNLPGRFSKKRQRRESDGKKDAALDILQFERILVEIIMDLNGSPVEPRRIPVDALHEGAKIASRAGLHSWALKNRAGFTRSMGENFVYEYLLTGGTGTIHPLGIQWQGELYRSERLRELGLLSAAVRKPIKVPLSYNPLLASEIYFFDTVEKKWLPAYNVDPEIYDAKASFAEVKELRTLQTRLVSQASFNNYSLRRVRVKSVKELVRETKPLGPVVTSPTNHIGIRQNRAIEKCLGRSEGLNGSIKDLRSGSAIEEVRAPTESIVLSEAKTLTVESSLWDEVDAINTLK
ncbi:hypothetical protein [Pseudomonas syringae]|uniref:Integrase catalytic domain-containing protein n=1 Tax=Pseudomonas syringae TaxID=317 RepID=A0A085V9Q8_PSESX|nr:hypothetical protein [Pseudomonas syringae]KFE52171.1 hypothetical protein IV02_10540 [Pseudomonas syringae]